jgi:tetratricopeptide (TPR) repeat protein
LTKNGFWQRAKSTFGLLIPLIALGIALIALYFVYLDRQTTRLVIRSDELDQGAYEDILQETEKTLQRAEDAVSAASLVLSFLEGFSVLAGIILLAAGILGFNSVQELRQDTQDQMQAVIKRLEQAETQLIERVELAERQLLDREQQLAAMQDRLAATLEQSQQRIDQQIAAASQAASLAFEALSHHIMAQRLARENNIDAAIIACRESHALNPNSIPNNYLLGTLLIRKNELDEAIELLTAAFELAQLDSSVSGVPAQAALGLAIRKKGDQAEDPMERNRLYNKAEQHLLEATQHDPQLLNEQKESYFGVLGSLYRRQGREQDSITAYKHALEITPRRSYPEINLAMLYLKQGDTLRSEAHRQRAEANAQRRLEDTPEDYWARYDLSLAKMLKGQSEEAIRLLEETIEITPDVMTLDSIRSRLLYLQQIGLELDGMSEALERIEKAQSRFQTSAEPA